MAFTYRVTAKLPPTPDFGDELVAHFRERGLRLTEEGDGEWTFQRGSKLAALYRFDIRSYDTVLRVRAEAGPDGDLEVQWRYDVWTFLSVLTTEDVRRLEAEVADFVLYCVPGVGEPRALMAVSCLPGRYLPIWVLAVVVLLPLLILGIVVGRLLRFWSP